MPPRSRSPLRRAPRGWSPEQLEARRAAVPAVTYPEQLPVSARRKDIAAAIRDHQVVVVAGETGSGKTTQLPKICLELGRGITGMVGHTQPRRIAARAVADRVADELGTEVGDVVGFAVRFTDHVGPRTLVKLMTDGILLAEIQRDRDLLAYDTLIIDEAHERSLNVDFLLGYLAQLLPRRPDLKVVITSATIDPHRFARHFGDAPVIEVSGRTYPVEVRYRPVVEEGGDPDRDQVEAIVDAVHELENEAPGDVLVFLSGEREIRDTAEALRRLHLRDTEVLPLFARLSAAEQHRIFAPHRGRRIVLSTNVAETSLTVPGIRYVVDPGTARISRYSHRLKVQRLPIEAISQASARQRAGRCGRLEDGICIRLYAEDDFAARPEFTDPEILRTNLAAVILQMTALGIGDVEAFPFLDPPDRRNVRDGVALLHELGALDPAQTDPRQRLTPLGRRLAQLPVDPRLGRMVLEADRLGCAYEVVVIAAALSIQDVRERPAEHQQAADESHRRFADPTSDFLTYLTLWRYLQEQQRALSSSAFRRACRAEFLHFLRVREWQDLVGQLRQVARNLHITVAGDKAAVDAPFAADDLVHQALLAGLLSHVGQYEPETREYAGARGARFAAWPGSALAKKPPAWVMAGELVETGRLWGRDLARIDPEWAESAGAHLVKRSYSEPHWSSKQGAVLGYERVTLYGVPIVARRRVQYSRIDPALCRELFIRHALVEGDWTTQHRFFHDNRALLEVVEELEHRTRRRDIVVDDEALFDFYDVRIPADAVSGRHFDAWWKAERREHPDLLTFEREMLVRAEAAAVDELDYPDVWRQGALALPLTYQFEPGADADGVTVHIPLGVLNQVSADGFDWEIPGLREDLVTALIRSLPKPVRVSFVPASDHARGALAQMGPLQRPLLDALTDALQRMTAVRVPYDAWNWSRVPEHLRMTYRVEDEGRPLGEGKDLAALQHALAPRLKEQLAEVVSDLEQTGLTEWSVGAVPRSVEQRRGQHVVHGFPALVDEVSSVALRVLPSADEQAQAMVAGVRRLLLLAVPSPVKPLLPRLDNRTKLALSTAPHGSATALMDDCVAAGVDTLVLEAGGQPWDAVAFDRVREQVRAELPETFAAVVRTVADVLDVASDIRDRILSTSVPALRSSLDDVRAQLDELVHPGFVTETGARRLPDLLRYLRAAQRRLDRLGADPHRDRALMARVTAVRHEVDKAMTGLPPARRLTVSAQRVRWMVEELRVSLWAQGLGTAHPVSEQRIYRALDDLGA